MQNPSDNELDNLFREAVKKSEATDANEGLADWGAVASRLDGGQRTAGRSALWKYSAIITTTVVVIFLIWFTNRQRDNTLEQSVIEMHAGDSDQESANQVEDIVEPAYTENELEQAVASESSRPASTGALSSPLDVYSDHTVLNSNHATAIGPNPKLTESVPSQAELPAADLPAVDEEGALNEAVLSEIDSVASIEQGHEKEQATGKVLSRWSIRGLVSPDYSTVNATKPSQIGFNYGALLEYHLTDRLRVSAGLLRARKVYTAMNLEYNGYNADEVEGDCRMWDIPLNVYCNIVPEGGSWSVYLGAGLSSYLMSEENYVYKFRAGYDWYTYDAQVKNENNEWFSILNLSVGLQKNLSDRVSLQVEPYIKAPLAGVGEGDVSLASFGAFFSLRYQLFQSTK